jgi:hypothetical protein
VRYPAAFALPTLPESGLHPPEAVPEEAIIVPGFPP